MTDTEIRAVLDGYRISLGAMSDYELEHEAAVVAALPGDGVAPQMRRLVDEEIEYRRAAARTLAGAR